MLSSMRQGFSTKAVPRLRRIWLLGPLFCYNLESHKDALFKFLFLWAISTLPVIFSVLFSAVPEGPGTVWQKFLLRLSQSFSLREQFAYTASFLAPLIYIAFDTFRNSDSSMQLKDRYEQIVRNRFHGYPGVLLVSVILLLVTAAAHATVSSGQNLDRVFFFALAQNLGLWIYACALYAGYLSVLDEKTPQGDFVKSSRRSETATTETLRARLEARLGGGNVDPS